MPHDVGAHLERTLEYRRRERVVHDQQGVVALRDLTHRAQVGEPHERVRRGLHQERPGGRRHRVLHPLRIPRVHIRERQPHMTQDLVEQAERAAIDILAADDVIAGAEQLHDRVEAAHAAREGEAVPAALQRRDVPFQRFTRGILSARVLVPLVDAEPVLDVGGREVHRRHDGARERLGTLAGVNAAGGDAAGEIFVENASHGLRLVRSEGEASGRAGGRRAGLRLRDASTTRFTGGARPNGRWPSRTLPGGAWTGGPSDPKPAA